MLAERARVPLVLNLVGLCLVAIARCQLNGARERTLPERVFS
jgi:hypothetical protein